MEKTGKTQVGLDAIVNQKDKNMVCIYVALGKTKKEVKDIYYELTKRGAVSYTIIIENKGTIKAEITDLIETPSYTKNTEAMTSIYPVEISHLDIVGKILEPGEQLELTIVASYKPTVTPQTKNINYQLSVIAKSYKEE